MKQHSGATLFAAMSVACLALHGGEIERKTTPVVG